jgi:hypothetical protein
MISTNSYSKKCANDGIIMFNKFISRFIHGICNLFFLLVSEHLMVNPSQHPKRRRLKFSSANQAPPLVRPTDCRLTYAYVLGVLLTCGPAASPKRKASPFEEMTDDPRSGQAR